jgi:hypothetical protein
MPDIHITGIDRMKGAAIVEFSDGSTAAYGVEFLYDHRNDGSVAFRRAAADDTEDEQR